jgi:hypothetical protein
MCAFNSENKFQNRMDCFGSIEWFASVYGTKFLYGSMERREYACPEQFRKGIVNRLTK